MDFPSYVTFDSSCYFKSICRLIQRVPCTLFICVVRSHRKVVDEANLLTKTRLVRAYSPNTGRKVTRFAVRSFVQGSSAVEYLPDYRKVTSSLPAPNVDSWGSNTWADFTPELLNNYFKNDFACRKTGFIRHGHLILPYFVLTIGPTSEWYKKTMSRSLRL